VLLRDHVGPLLDTTLAQPAGLSAAMCEECNACTRCS
jgi:hypothetical protein